MRGSLAWEERGRRPPRSGPSVSFYGTPLFSPSMPHRCFNSGDKLGRIKCSGPGTAGPAAGERGELPPNDPAGKRKGRPTLSTLNSEPSSAGAAVPDDQRH